MLYVELLGGVRVSWGEPRQALMLNRQSVALLAHLMLSRSRREPRETLVEQFWPEAGPEQGRRNLSTALFRLRQSLAAARNAVCFDSIGDISVGDHTEVWLDADAFRSAVRPFCASRARLLDEDATRLSAALALYKGELLQGFFDDWVLAEREELRLIYIRGQLRLLEHHAEGGELESALECGREVTRLDPLRESVHRTMMQLYSRNGEPAAARNLYHRLVGQLKADLGVDPAPETVATYRSL